MFPSIHPSPTTARRIPNAFLFLLGLCAAAGCALHPPPSGAGADSRIDYATALLARYPLHYPAQADLALAYLDKARQTLAPVWLNEARRAAQRSLDIQANHEAYKVMAAIEGFAHRFAESIRWAELARETLPTDTEVTSRIVEALLGLGRSHEARHLLRADAAAATDFHTLTAFALVARADGDAERAAGAFERAGLLASAQRSPAFAVWGYVMAAATWLDAGELEKAEGLLNRAAAIDAESAIVRLHRAELNAAAGRLGEAADLYARALRRHPDAEGYRRAMTVARSLGDEKRAHEYRSAAERLLLPAVEAGEVYTLGELARLYRDAAVHLDRALQLAEENVRHVHDAEALATLASIRALLQR